MIKIPLPKLRSAATIKPQGYYDACIAAGAVVDNVLELSESAFAELREQFSPPPLTTQLQSAAIAVVAECGSVLNGEPAIDEETQDVRLSACEACEWFIARDRRCGKCRCWMEVKTRFRTAKCPEGKW